MPSPNHPEACCNPRETTTTLQPVLNPSELHTWQLVPQAAYTPTLTFSRAKKSFRSGDNRVTLQAKCTCALAAGPSDRDPTKHDVRLWVVSDMTHVIWLPACISEPVSGPERANVDLRAASILSAPEQPSGKKRERHGRWEVMLASECSSATCSSIYNNDRCQTWNAPSLILRLQTCSPSARTDCSHTSPCGSSFSSLLWPSTISGLHIPESKPLNS